MLLHIISLLDVVDLLKFEAAAKSAAQIGASCDEEKRAGHRVRTAVLCALPVVMMTAAPG